MSEASTLLDQPERTSPTISEEVRGDDHWDLVIRPKRHLLDINFKEIWDYRDLLYMFVKRDIVTVYKQTILGPIWFFIQPIMTMAVYVLVFGNIANISTDGIPRPLFYLAGIVMWNYFADTFNRTSTTFATNADIFGKVYFPRSAGSAVARGVWTDQVSDPGDALPGGLLLLSRDQRSPAAQRSGCCRSPILSP